MNYQCIFRVLIKHVEKPSGRDGTQGMDDSEIRGKGHSKIK